MVEEPLTNRHARMTAYREGPLREHVFNKFQRRLALLALGGVLVALGVGIVGGMIVGALAGVTVVAGLYAFDAVWTQILNHKFDKQHNRFFARGVTANN